MFTGSFADPRKRRVAVFGVRVIHTVGVTNNAKF